MLRPTVKQTRAGVLVLLALAGTVSGWGALTLLAAAGRTPPAGSWVTTAGMIAAAAVLFALGLPVRRWNRGHRDRPLNPLYAFRVLVLAKACSHTAAFLVGWYAGALLRLAPRAVSNARGDLLTGSLVAVGAAALLVVAGLVVERFCKLPPDDEDPERSGNGAS